MQIIGNEFVYVFDDEASKLKDVKFLAQGTLYTDVIESGTPDTAQNHQITTQCWWSSPEDMQFELIEPLNTLTSKSKEAARKRTKTRALVVTDDGPAKHPN